MALALPELIQTEDKQLVRETRSGALLNTSKAALERNRRARARISEQNQTNQEVRSLRSVVMSLDARVQELTGLLENALTLIKR